MHQHSATLDDAASGESAVKHGRWLAALETTAILAVFVVYAGWPTPEPNEAHYVAKAKHAWNPGWAAEDFFLDSHDTHAVFYWTLGWLTVWLPLSASAWVGRLITWALLAAAIRRLSWLLWPRPGWAVFTAALFLPLSDRFHMAGEWVVGGLEAKSVAYALVFFGLGDVARGRWNRAWILLGAASSFHVVVGGWSTIAVAVSWLTTGRREAPLRSIAWGLAAGMVCAMPGILPALSVAAGAEGDVAASANTIYVYQRLKHHLSFFSFPWQFVARHALLIAIWWLACWRLAPSDADRRFRWVVHAAILIAVAGVAINFVGQWRPTWAAGLARFYWFRLGDSFVALGVSLAASRAASQLWSRNALAGRGAVALVAIVVAGWIVAEGGLRPWPRTPRADKPGKTLNHDDWRAACMWVAENTPPDAIVLTPRDAQSFKWYSGRGEVVTWKDIPQDAESIVAWWTRLRDVHGRRPDATNASRWRRRLAEHGAEQVIELAHKYGASYVLTEVSPPLVLPRLYANHSYAVYAIPESPKPSQPAP